MILKCIVSLCKTGDRWKEKERYVESGRPGLELGLFPIDPWAACFSEPPYHDDPALFCLGPCGNKNVSLCVKHQVWDLAHSSPSIRGVHYYTIN